MPRRRRSPAAATGLRRCRARSRPSCAGYVHRGRARRRWRVPRSRLSVRRPQSSGRTRSRLSGSFRSATSGRLAIACRPSRASGNPWIYYAGSASGGSSRRPMAGRRGRRFSTVSPCRRSGRSPSRRQTRTSSGPVRARPGSAATSRRHGIYKSIDAGKTWTLMGLENTGRIGRSCRSENPTSSSPPRMGHSYGPQHDRGLFRTRDGGKTWKKVLFVDESTGCSDVAMDRRTQRAVRRHVAVRHPHMGRRAAVRAAGCSSRSDGGVDVDAPAVTVCPNRSSEKSGSRSPRAIRSGYMRCWRRGRASHGKESRPGQASCGGRTMAATTGR